MIDLHLHTTASDGRLTPDALVDRVAAAGVRVMAVTDHDTTAAVSAVRARAATYGVEVVNGIEMTAVDGDHDVHVLGYFVDCTNAGLQAFLSAQRGARVARVEAIGARLAALGLPVDLGGLLAVSRADGGRSVGRPQVAQAMVAAGHALDTHDAFARWLGRGRPAFVPRAGVGCAEVIGAIHAAGGLASLAHPRISVDDARLAPLCEQGLDAIEAFHPEHAPADTARYLAVAATLGLLVTGGSDFHGDAAHGATPGAVNLPLEQWTALRAAGRNAG